MKNNHKSKRQIEEEKRLEYGILGDAFLGDLFNMSEELDNTYQNLIMHSESDEIKKIIKDIKYRR
ncbi:MULTISPECIES: hypothetical protein [unclassified Romboutsia]|uniref:hypothetical protein n=1 Tax=unclassified Romboutsia TaxID=2626894 RepID=UPI0008217908|nr:MULTISPECIES: hypothetical protein [unclassified Romboutsia]SCH61580.1 Uncharacterised protein [uncultured Clostridium sp.]